MQKLRVYRPYVSAVTSSDHLFDTCELHMADAAAAGAAGCTGGLAGCQESAGSICRRS